MASTSAEVFRIIEAGGRATGEQIDLLRREEPGQLFGELVEPLADSFEPAYVDAYVDVFGRLLERMLPDAGPLRERYAQLRESRPAFDPKRVVVLSRVTIGADIAITSTLLDAARQRWPQAEICFAGSRKNQELFQGTSLIAAPYLRTGTLDERIHAGLQLAPLLDQPDTLVIDPDSRLSQLGLLPLAPVERTLFLETRSAGGNSDSSLVRLTQAFAKETLGVNAKPWIAPNPSPGQYDVTVSFGVGENPAKRIDDRFEEDLIRSLLDRGLRVLLDSGAPGTAEWQRAGQLARHGVSLWQGSFATFAAAIRECRLYVGYDSAGQHAAAAMGVPRVTVFAGAPNSRFVSRWRPVGRGASHVVTPGPDILERTQAAIASVLA